MNQLADRWARNFRRLWALPHYGHKPARAYPGWDAFEYPDPSASTDNTAGGPLVAFCADVSPASLLAAYRRGLMPLPMPDNWTRMKRKAAYSRHVAKGTLAIVGSPSVGRDAVDPYWVEWWSPDPRPVLDVSAVHLGKNVRRQLRRLDLWTTANTAFKRVAEECRAGRSFAWLTNELLSSLVALHDDGWAHSIEVWLDGRLVGGTIGLGMGTVMSGDTAFGRVPEAARIALADTAARLRDAGGQLIDAQIDSPLLRSVGASLVSRSDYLALLSGSSVRVPIDGKRLPAQRLLSA